LVRLADHTRLDRAQLAVKPLAPRSLPWELESDPPIVVADAPEKRCGVRVKSIGSPESALV
jgi:hypothetical protein